MSESSDTWTHAWQFMFVKFPFCLTFVRVPVLSLRRWHRWSYIVVEGLASNDTFVALLSLFDSAAVFVFTFALSRDIFPTDDLRLCARASSSWCTCSSSCSISILATSSL